MRTEREQIEALTRVCVDDLLSGFGLGGLRRGRRFLELLSRIPAQRVAREIANYDQIVGESGLSAGGAWALERMVGRVEIEGRERVPTEGSLLLVSNHPGLADAVALFSAIPRPDLRVVAAQWPLLDALPNTSRYLITVAKGSSNRFAVLKSAARHLKHGGALLNFPAGRMEPDPAVLPGAVEALERWSTSVDLFARLAPEPHRRSRRGQRRDLPHRPAQPAHLSASSRGGPLVARLQPSDARARAAQRHREGRLRCPDPRG